MAKANQQHGGTEDGKNFSPPYDYYPVAVGQTDDEQFRKQGTPGTAQENQEYVQASICSADY